MRLLPLFAALLLLSCGSRLSPNPAPAATSSKPTPTYLALGDSYTIGEGETAVARWPVQLASLAQLAPPDIIARTGWTTAELATAIAASGNTRTYDLVTLLIGVNNQYRGQPVTQYRPEFRQLLQTASRYAGNRPGRVVVLSIPDWGQSPFAAGQDRARIGSEIDQFNAAAQQECQQAGVAFVTITPLTRAAAGDAAQFTPDGLHYSGLQMRRWAEAALPAVRVALQ